MTTTNDILTHMKMQLGFARSSVKQAQIRGYSPDYDMGRVATLAGLIASFGPEFQDAEDGSKFISRMFDFEDVPEYFTPGDAA